MQMTLTCFQRKRTTMIIALRPGSRAVFLASPCLPRMSCQCFSETPTRLLESYIEIEFNMEMLSNWPSRKAVS
ncbi:hypothetical protein BT96DRAFT_285325 [Gymnopus androsaceus JB14]|uniref:Uncharacterized protein n=1 Tax=Gymnopus androsaceus JB14 TaxID=1447944 RepID=A0A6A4H1S2_9AGAR|nr:hypothetical protein BT96DRAFT_285325 [Gymnopus androsaceus JB14]